MQGGWQPPPGGGGYGPPGYTGGPPQGYGPPTQQTPYAAPQMGMMPMQQQQYGNYEFNDLENSVIGKAAGRAKLWGWIAAVLGVFQLLGGACGSIQSAFAAMYVPTGIVMLIVGVTFIGVGNSLTNVVSTQGNDVGHMMQALQKLGNAFLIQSITTIVFSIVGAIVFFFVILFAIAGAASG